ncbi:hypothetical protein COCMIDRAFT_98978 [Bipolaris oryzae ATCC 44560]|uniref:NACHT domain-containing protein n=1 Tax=Bipolaris oryzae ATCC 44560 TaxID=930090 RepID=W6Z2L6_COCMI|nr:uncharacterized protein COCMIDRAFT_98978 [Bipolaris oryzae ATCC 44560]EUC44175.1 hypothetical protein COCMIDRAFT_98978 [Bipolaris oryzae ATCC 44560]
MRGVAIGIQADPAISSPVVGVLRVIIDIGLEFSKFFTRLTDMICEFEDYLGPLSEHSQAADIELVEHAVVSVYTNMLEFGWKARSVFIGSNGKRRRFTSFRAFKRQHWDTFETEFMSMKQQMQHHLHVLQHTVQATHFSHSRITAQSRSSLLSIARTERREFLSWVSDIDFEEVHQTTYTKKHRGTGDWLTREPKFQEWMQSPHSSLLWCNGKPGIGKSVLSSHVLEHITAEAGLRERTAICFAYYNYRDTRLASITTIIATLIKQLCQGMHDIPENLLEIMRNARSPSLLGSKEYFFSLMEKSSEVFVVFDALDECPEERREDVLGFITEAVTMPAPHCVKIFATSRREMDITEAFLKKNVPTIQISADSVAADIETFARSRVEELGSGQHGKTLYITSDDLKEEIIQTLAQKAEGIFLWVNLQLENLCQASKAQNDEVVKEALHTLPRDLPDTYIRILERIETQSPYMRDLAIRCLAWVLYAQRPLETQELQTALAINSKCKTQEDLRPISLKVILEACGNLLEEANRVTRPIHYIVQEFLTTAVHGPLQHKIRRQLLDSKSLHKNLSLDCLMYIDLMSFSKPASHEWELLEQIRDHDLAIYAYTSFDYHIWNSVEPSSDATNKLGRLLQKDSSCLAALLQITLLSNDSTRWGSTERFRRIDFRVTPATIIYSTRLYNIPTIKQRWVGQTPPIYALHLAASAGLVDAIIRLLEEGSEIDEKDGDQCTSMYYACQNGHLDIAQILVNKGADIHARGGYFDNALQVASYQGHTQIVQMLLDAGADVNLEGGLHSSAL